MCIQFKLNHYWAIFSIYHVHTADSLKIIVFSVSSPCLLIIIAGIITFLSVVILKRKASRGKLLLIPSLILKSWFSPERIT